MALLKTKLPSDTEESQVRMGFGEHIEEFRRRLIFALLGSLGGVVLCLYYVSDIISFILRPYLVALKLAHYPATLLATGTAEVFMNYLSVGIKAGLVVSSPWIIYQLWLFVAAGLYERERRIVYRYIGPSIALFFSGAAFFFFIILPMSLHFFMIYSQNTAPLAPAAPNWFERKIIWRLPDQAQSAGTQPASTEFPPISVVARDPTTFPNDRFPVWYNATEQVLKGRLGDRTMTFLLQQDNSLFMQLPKLNEYLTFVIWAMVIFGVCFELPMVMLVLAQIGIITAAGFRKIRRYAIFGIAVFAAIAAPAGDVLSMMSLAIPMMGLYELGILLAAVVGKKATAAESS